MEIIPGIGFSKLLFGASMADAVDAFGHPEETGLLDELEDSKSVVWHYWENGFTLFFEAQHQQIFNCVEIDNTGALLWGHRVFESNEKQIIELFKKKGILKYEKELHEWGEKRLSFDEAHIDFYFEKNKLNSINYCKPLHDSPILILPN